MLDIDYFQFYNFNGIYHHKRSWRKLLYIKHKPIDFSRRRRRREGRVSNMENKNNNLLWLCINRYAPELKINNIKETLIKTGVTFFNLHRMEKGYFPTSLIKFQVENKTDISYLINKNIKIGDHEYALRKFTEKPHQNNRYRATTKI